MAPEGTRSYPGQEGREEGGREGAQHSQCMHCMCSRRVASTTLTWWSLEGARTEKRQQELQLILLVDDPRHQEVVTDLNQRSAVGNKLVVTCMPRTTTTTTASLAGMVLT